MNVRELIEMLSHKDVDQDAPVKFVDVYNDPFASEVTGMVYSSDVVLTNEEKS